MSVPPNGNGAARDKRLTSVVILGLSIATVVLVVARTIFGHRLIAQESRIAEEARESDEEHRSVVESSPDAIVVSDLEHVTTVANQSAADLFGFASASELIGLDMIEFVAPDERPRVLGARRRRLALEEPVGRNVQYRMKRRDGSEFHCAVSSAVLLNPEGHPRGMIRIIRDISERKQFELELIRQATHDDLTGLPNRALLRDRLDQALTMSRRLGTPGALLLMDLYRFKVVNDTFGHAIGDELLKLVGSRLQAVLRECDTVARLGGDEFAIHLANTDTDGTRRVATKVLTAMSEPFVVDNNEFLVDASLGAALYPTNGASVGELLRVADVAMYDAKSSGAGFTMYKTDIDDYDPKQMVVLTDLKKAIERDGLELYYQPKVRTYSGEVDSVEALARWHHPTRGDISPSEFIPLAEWTGLMMPLTKWVLRSALRQAKQWELEGHPMCVAVNLSASSLHDASLTDTLVGLLDEAGVSPSLLEIEVTETAVMSDLVRAAGVLQRLADLGITLSIDDFGTGYSSIAQLKRLPVSEIKIDRSFVHDISTDKDDMSIVRSLISLGHSLNLTVVAEGVEDGESVRILRKARCDMIQGFYYAKPMPANDLNQWLRARDSNTDATRGSRQVA